jgi:regulator of replication initiation timing
MSKELFKTIEAQGRLITELRAENEQLKWQLRSELVDLRKENEQIRRKFNELGELSTELVDYNYDSERTHYDEVIDEDGEGGESHIFHTLLMIQKLIK